MKTLKKLASNKKLRSNKQKGAPFIKNTYLQVLFTLFLILFLKGESHIHAEDLVLFGILDLNYSGFTTYLPVLPAIENFQATASLYTPSARPHDLAVSIYEVGSMDLAISTLGTEASEIGSGPGLSIETPLKSASIKQIIGPLLIYPNPFRFADGAHIGYRLGDNMDITLQIYSFSGYLISSKTFIAGQEEGALSNYNHVPINSLSLGLTLPAGVYLYLLISEGKVIAKDKMVVLP